MKKRGYIIFSVLSFLCSFFAICGWKLEKQGNIIWTGDFLWKVLFVCMVIGLICGVGLTHLFLLVKHIKKDNKEEKPVIFKHKLQIFAVSWGSMFLSWIPAFFAFYPGNCTYDIGGQTWYIFFHNYEAHHPIAHTLLMELFLRIGMAFDNVNMGMAMYVLFQMAWLAGAFAFGIMFLHSLRINFKWLIVLQVWSMFFIPNIYMSISTTKDVIFTAEVLLMLLCLYRIVLQKRNELRVDIWDVGFVINGVLMVLFRNNGKYALLVTFCMAVFVVLFSRKDRKLYVRIAGSCVCVLLVGNLLLASLSYMTHASEIRKEEMLSVPIQQLSRVMKYQDEISETDKSIIDGFIINKAYEKYIPSIADPVKANVDLSFLYNHLQEFAGTYFRLLLSYPGDFVNAVLALDAGYLNPLDTTYKDVYTWGAKWLRLGWSPMEEMGLTQDSKFPALFEWMNFFAEEDLYCSIPVLGCFVMPGGYLWICLFFAGWLLWKKKYHDLFVWSYVAGYFVTLLLGPTVQLRYIYTVMAVFPFLYIGMIGKKDCN